LRDRRALYHRQTKNAWLRLLSGTGGEASCGEACTSWRIPGFAIGYGNTKKFAVHHNPTIKTDIPRLQATTIGMGPRLQRVCWVCYDVVGGDNLIIVWQARRISGDKMSEQKLPSSVQAETVENRSDTLNQLIEIIRSAKLPKREEQAEQVFLENMRNNKIDVEPISTKRGFKIYLAELGDKRYAVWIRAKPVSRKSLEMTEKILKNYELDGKILVKLVRKADYIKISSWVKYND